MDRIETRNAGLQYIDPANPLAGTIEYGFTLSVAVFLIWWIINTLSKKLENIEGLLGKQVDATKEVHQQVKDLKDDFDRATATANTITGKIADRLSRRWF